MENLSSAEPSVLEAPAPLPAEEEAPSLPQSSAPAEVAEEEAAE